MRRSRHDKGRDDPRWLCMFNRRESIDGRSAAAPVKHDGSIDGRSAAAPVKHGGSIDGRSAAAPVKHGGSIDGRSAAAPVKHGLIEKMIFLVVFVLMPCLGCQSKPSDNKFNGESEHTTVELVEPIRLAEPDQFLQELIRGRVVWLNETLKSRFAVSTVPEVAKNSLALMADDGRLLPVVEDSRGRAFRLDEQLRSMNVELLVRRHERHPMLQILRVYEIADGKRFLVDYWCDVCAIEMIEKGQCACCQDDNRLRKQEVEEQDAGKVDAP